MKIMDVINDISNFIQYFAAGYLFFCTYNYIGCLQREEHTEYLIVKGITASFILNSFVTFIVNKVGKGQEYYYLVLIFTACISGIVLGILRRTKLYRNLIKKVFHRTITDNILTLMYFEAANRECLCLRFRVSGSDSYYEGQIDEISSIYQDPIIILKYYVIRDRNRNVINDFSKCDRVQLIIKWSQMEDVEMALGDENEK
nr:hypothetical protein [uncultured Blautia sp.]